MYLLFCSHQCCTFLLGQHSSLWNYHISVILMFLLLAGNEEFDLSTLCQGPNSCAWTFEVVHDALWLIMALSDHGTHEQGLSARRMKPQTALVGSSSLAVVVLPALSLPQWPPALGAAASQAGEEKLHGGPAGKEGTELLLCKFRGGWREREGGQGRVSCLQWAGGKSLQHSPEMLSDALPQHSLPSGPIPKKARCLSKALGFSTPLATLLQAHEAATLPHDAQEQGGNL